jgi:DNA-directed RNA polymerase specialized sigma24 family protein
MATTETRRRRTVGDDPALAARLRTGDPAAFENLYRRHHQQVARYVTARLAGRHPDAVDDLVQDTFADAIAEAGRFDDDVFGCLLRLAARAVTRHLWAARRHARAVYTVYEDHPAVSDGQPVAPVSWAAPAGRIEVSQALAQEPMARLRRLATARGALPVRTCGRPRCRWRRGCGAALRLHS